MPISHACSFVHQAAMGLQHAHEAGMVHRDIKPDNLMLTHEGGRAIVKVLDFGLAKATSEQAATELASGGSIKEMDAKQGLTHTGWMLGTPTFIAPEQIVNAQKADIRADIYSLGCTLYYLLAGRPPFEEPTVYDTLKAHRSTEAQLLNLVRPDVPPELATLVAKMMAKKPGDRFQAPAEVADALRAILQEVVSRRRHAGYRRQFAGATEFRSWVGALAQGRVDVAETLRRRETGYPGAGNDNRRTSRSQAVSPAPGRGRCRSRALRHLRRRRDHLQVARDRPARAPAAGCFRRR